MGSVQRCKQWSAGAGGWGGVPCNRELKTPGQREAGMCGRHLAGQRRSEAAEEDRRNLNAAKERVRQRAEALTKRFAPFGISAKAHYKVGASPKYSGYTGSIVISAADAEKLTALLGSPPTPDPSAPEREGGA